MASGSVTGVTGRDHKPNADLRQNTTSSGGEDTTMTSHGSENMTMTSFGDSGETVSDSQPMSPGSDAGRNLAVDYMKSKYEKDKKPKKEPIVIPKLIREPKKLDIHWDKVVDEKLKRSEQATPVIKEQDLVAMMLTFAGLDSGKSQYMSLVENSGRDPETASVSREPVENVGPPEITKTVRNMFETGKIKDIDDYRTQHDTYDALTGSGVFENEPVRSGDEVRRESDFNDDGEGVQSGLTKNLLDHWKTKMADDASKSTPPNRRAVLAEGDEEPLEGVRRDDASGNDDLLDWEVAHIEKGLTKSLTSQWSTIGSKEFKPERRHINVADAEGKVLESHPIRRNDVIRSDDVIIQEGETVQKGLTKSLLSQWSGVNGSAAADAPIQRKRINVACAEGRVAENEPVRRSDVVREGDASLDGGDQVEKGLTKSLLHQWSTKDRESFAVERRAINVAEDEGRVAESEPVRRSDVVSAYDTDESDVVVQKGTTRSLLEQWKTKGSDAHPPSGTKGLVILDEAEGVVAENEPVRRADVVRESDTFADDGGGGGGAVQRGTTRNLLDQWQNKRGGDDVKSRDRTPINVAEAEAVVAENEPTRRNDVARENDLDHSDIDRIQTGTTKSLLDQWQNRRPEFTKDKTPIVIDEGEGTVAENDPVRRADVVREDDCVVEGEVLPRGLTKSILNQWNTKSTQRFSIDRKPISVAEDEGTVAENEPVRRPDVVRADDDVSTEGVQVQEGTTKGLLEKWTSRGREKEEVRTVQRDIRIAEDDGRIAENEPERRDDLIRECEEQTGSKVEVKKGFTKQLLSQWTDKGSEGFTVPKRRIVVAEDDGIVAENDPSPRHDVVREFDDGGENERVQPGITKKLLGEWTTKGGQDRFRAPRKEIVLAEDEGFIAENEPIQRSDIIKETDLKDDDADKIQKGTANYLLGQWKNKGAAQFKAPRSEINLAEDEGVIAESTPVQRNDVVREYDRNAEEEKTVQKGLTKSLLGQWKNKGNEQYKVTRKEIVLAEDEGRVAESQPIERSDVLKEDCQNPDGESVQKGFTKALLGQWKNKGSEEFRVPKREIVLAEDEGKVAENQPKQRCDVAREYESNQESEEIQRGYTKSLLGQWKNRGTEEYRAPKKEIILAEDEGKVAENQPVQRKDIIRECDASPEGETIQRGYTKNLLGQWKNKGKDEFRVPRKEIILAEDEGKIAESQPVYRSDVAREYDENAEGEMIQQGYTKNLLGQWKNKGNEEFRVPRKEIILAEDEGKIAESQPVYRSDVAREYDENAEGEMIQRGYTKNLLGQWKNKGNEGYRAPKREIVLAEDEGKIAENVPTQRNDVAREDDPNAEGDRVKRGITKNLLGQWKNKSNEEFRSANKEIILAEDEGRIVENEPIRRPDVVRECDFHEEGERIRRGTTQNLLSQWKTKGNREFQNPRRPIVIAEDEGRICESEPVQRTDAVREFNGDSSQERPRSGQARNLKTHWMTSPQAVASTRRSPVNMIESGDNGPCVVENDPVVRDDVIRERDNAEEEVCLRRGFARDLAGYWQNAREAELQQKEPFRLEMDMSTDDRSVHENTPTELQGVTKCEGPQEEVMGKRGHIQTMTKQFLGSNVRPSPGKIHQQQVNLDLADGPTVLENQPAVRSDVIREIDQEPDVISIAQARNTRQLWSNLEKQEDRTATPETFREPVRFTPPRELTPPPVHQEDFRSYQSITLSSGPSTFGPMSSSSSSSSSSSQSRRSAAPLGESGPQQNRSNVSRSTAASS